MDIISAVLSIFFDRMRLRRISLALLEISFICVVFIMFSIRISMLRKAFVQIIIIEKVDSHQITQNHIL